MTEYLGTPSPTLDLVEEKRENDLFDDYYNRDYSLNSTLNSMSEETPREENTTQTQKGIKEFNLDIDC